MNKQDFDNLAERVLLAICQARPDVTAQHLGQQAIKITDEFVKALNLRHMDQARKKTSLTPEEISLLHEKPHPRVIECIKLVRERTNMNLKECKDLVDKARGELGLL